MFSDKLKSYLEDAKTGFDLFSDIWHKDGWSEETGEQVAFKDLMATTNATRFLPKVVEQIVREPVEPLQVIPRLLDQVTYTPGLQIGGMALGAMAAFDIGEAEAYPEQSLQLAPGYATINVGKTGVKFSITEEMMSASQFDLISMHLRAAGRALQRHKEVKGMTFIKSLGVTLFDNKTPTSSIFGTCTGRALSGAANGSCRMEDLLNAYSHLMMQGFVPDVLIMHPLAWSIWMADPMLRTIAMNTGNGAWFQPHNMAKTSMPWESASSKTGKSAGAQAFVPSGNAASATPTDPKKLDPTLNSAAVIPSYFPHPLTVIVSPFAPFNENNNTADIMIADSRNIGALAVDYEPRVDRWEDLSVDIMNVKVREKYGFAIYNEGLGIGVLKNVPIKANEIAFPAQATISSSGSFTDLTVTTAISGL